MGGYFGTYMKSRESVSAAEDTSRCTAHGAPRLQPPRRESLSGGTPGRARGLGLAVNPPVLTLRGAPWLLVHALDHQQPSRGLGETPGWAAGVRGQSPGFGDGGDRTLQPCVVGQGLSLPERPRPPRPPPPSHCHEVDVVRGQLPGPLPQAGERPRATPSDPSSRGWIQVSCPPCGRERCPHPGRIVFRV